MKRRLLRAAAIALGLSAVAILSTAFYLRLDKTHVFEQIRGQYESARVIESWSTEASHVRLLELYNHRGEDVARAYVRRPIELAPDYKIVSIYAGVKTRERILELIPERPDVVLIGPQYPYESPRGLGQHLRLPHDIRHAAYRSVAGGMLALSFLEEDEGLEPSRVILVGSSIGTAFATIQGGLDPRVERVILIHGGGDLPAIIRFFERRRGHRWRGEIEALLAEVFVDTFDPLHYAERIAPRELIMIGARGDGTFPTESTLALYERAKEPKTLIWTETDHVRSKEKTIVDEILLLVEERL